MTTLSFFVKIFFVVSIFPSLNIAEPLAVHTGPGIEHIPANRVRSFIKIEHRAYIITNNDSVFVVGHDKENSEFPSLLGLGDGVRDVHSPQQLIELNGVGIVKICSGRNHMLALSENGSIWSWGSNVCGQLGLWNNSDEETLRLANLHTRPEIIPDFSNAIDIECGSNVSFAITSNKSLYAWGKYSKSSDSVLMLQPTKLKIDNVTEFKITGIDLFMFALTTSNKVYVWGLSMLTLEQSKPKSIRLANSIQPRTIVTTTHYGFILGSDGCVYIKEANSDAKKLPASTIRFKAIYADRRSDRDLLITRGIDNIVYVWRDTQKNEIRGDWIVIDYFDEYGVSDLVEGPPHMSFMVRPSLAWIGAESSGSLGRMIGLVTFLSLITFCALFQF